MQINGYITDDTTFVYERNVFARERLFGATLDGTTQPANQSFFGDKFDQSTIPDVDFFNQNGISGIETSAQVIRTLPVRTSYT